MATDGLQMFCLIYIGYFGLNCMVTTFSLSVINQSPRIYQVPVLQSAMGDITGIKDMGSSSKGLIDERNHQYIIIKWLEINFTVAWNMHKMQ